MWLETDRFAFMREIQRFWFDIKVELHALGESDFVPWGQTYMFGEKGGWYVFPFWADLYPEMQPFCEKNRARCPRTAELVGKIPGMTSAGFSCLLPGTHVLPHVGHDRGCLRSHLALVVPDGCAMRVGDETRGWKEGEWLVFDDLTDHEAWNRGPSVRVVLMVDFQRSVYGV